MSSMCWFCSSPTCEGCPYEFSIYDAEEDSEK